MEIKDDGTDIKCLEQPSLSFLFLLSVSRPFLDTFFSYGKKAKGGYTAMGSLLSDDEGEQKKDNLRGIKEGKEECQEKTKNALTFFSPTSRCH